MESWLERADEEMARTHPKRYAAPRIVMPEPDPALPPAIEPKRAPDPRVSLVDATIRWLVAYRAQETDERRSMMGTGYSGLPGAVGPERRPVRR